MGRSDDIGSIEVGKSADFIAFNVDTIAFAGAQHDIVAALVFCTPPTVDYSVINGKVVVKEGHVMTLDLPPLIEQHNRISKALIDAS